jgi:hypothetical protein
LSTPPVAKAECCMPPDRHDVLLRKAKQDELVLERLLDDCDVDRTWVQVCNQYKHHPGPGLTAG